jgi:hypothetical protein
MLTLADGSMSSLPTNGGVCWSGNMFTLTGSAQPVTLPHYGAATVSASCGGVPQWQQCSMAGVLVVSLFAVGMLLALSLVISVALCVCRTKRPSSHESMGDGPRDILLMDHRASDAYRQ